MPSHGATSTSATGSNGGGGRRSIHEATFIIVGRDVLCRQASLVRHATSHCSSDGEFAVARSTRTDKNEFDLWRRRERSDGEDETMKFATTPTAIPPFLFRRLGIRNLRRLNCAFRHSYSVVVVATRNSEFAAAKLRTPRKTGGDDDDGGDGFRIRRAAGDNHGMANRRRRQKRHNKNGDGDVRIKMAAGAVVRMAYGDGGRWSTWNS